MAFQMGSRGAEVASVQAKLNVLLSPSPNLVTDGVFGMKTSQAVKLFQQRKGMSADGVVGPKTAAALGLPSPGQGGGGGHVQPSVPGPPHMQPPSGNTPPGFVDLSGFNVVIEAVISGIQAIASSLLSWIDSDYVPQIVYDRAANLINEVNSSGAAQLRNITKQAITAGQDPAAFVTAKIQEILGRAVSKLCNALQPLVGLPIIGAVAVRFLGLISSVMSPVVGKLANLRSNGQAAQAVALEIASIFQNIARQIR